MKYHLAQINIGKMLAPADSPLMAEFMDNLDHINGLAEQSEGFVWRLRDDSNNATSIRIFDDEFIIVNISVWENMETLGKFVYQTVHADFLRRRKSWFEKMDKQYLALWYIPAGTTPSLAEAIERLEHIRMHGETPYAFGFRKNFTVEETMACKQVNSR